MAEFFIQLDKEYYFSGDTVNGYVYINVHTDIPSATGYECVKWLVATELHRPRPNPNRPKNAPPPYDPIAAIPPHQLHQQNTNVIAISSCESQDNRQKDHRPKYIKTPSNRYFKMRYYETRNLFTKNKSMIYNCQGLVPGQYSFPFCFKTFEEWPASFQHKTQKKKGVIVYHMTASIETSDNRAQLKHGQQITLRQSRWLQSKSIKHQAQITSCCCLGQGQSSCQVHFEKDGYMPGQQVRLIAEVDNSMCEADIDSIRVSIDYTVTMKSQGASTRDAGNITSSGMPGVLAKQSRLSDNPIFENFKLDAKRKIKPTCSGKLLSNQYHLSVRFSHNISCQCCSDHLGASIPIIIFPIVKIYPMPPVFQTGWSPQVMPQYDMNVQNSFQNEQINSMQQGYPGQQEVHPEMNMDDQDDQQYGQNEQTMQQMQG